MPARALNGVMALAIGRLGLPLPRLWMLHVRGRRGGRARPVPVFLLHLRGRRYLVAPRGETGWARNLRATGRGELRRGRRRRRFAAEEVHGEEREAAVAAYVRRFGWLTGRFFALPRGPTHHDVREIAGRHPTFRLHPAEPSGDRAP